jgi:hypothetical protein
MRIGYGTTGNRRPNSARTVMDQLTKTANICLIYDLNVWPGSHKRDSTDCDNATYELHGRL